ncbi:uncharacterized protein BJ171DRAFT_464339 [Polychytrium aggregatum]|uniref:uncharacterized protein n=1 Tax=Polychytrium aggregatum TaxID=110093 RepID=UPI0022FE1A4F|nr:uncharacterized protein BJ171DRAFT_464339 [Polychytrium aggregatum]KAI9193478.1 hypothetical protein BJ171DRAFT_464339 [Polychytrium aggregatum]
MSDPNAVAGLQARLTKLVLNIQFLWFIGHLTTLSQSALFILSGGKSYYKAYYGVILCYGIILYKCHGTPKFSRDYFQKVMTDENAQYLLLAIVWVSSAPISVTLLPYATFSLFQFLSYTRQSVLPAIFPPVAGAASGLTQQVSASIDKFVKANQQPALRAVAFIEVFLILPFLIVSVFGRYASFTTPILFIQFLRFRYFFSSLTKQAVHELRSRLDVLFGLPAVPAVVQNGYRTVRDLIVRYLGADGAAAANANANAGN